MFDASVSRRRNQVGGPAWHKSELSAARQQLIEVFQDVNFGWVKGLVVRAGEPVMDPLPQIIHDVKFQADNEPRPERAAADFRLKAQQVELIVLLDRVWDGTIESIECRHGLPFRAQVVQPARPPAA